jgi:hypothetical protein
MRILPQVVICAVSATALLREAVGLPDQTLSIVRGAQEREKKICQGSLSKEERPRKKMDSDFR